MITGARFILRVRQRILGAHTKSWNPLSGLCLLMLSGTHRYEILVEWAVINLSFLDDVGRCTTAAQN